MKLLDVKAVLDRETNIQHADPEREVLRELDVKGTRYAILSHRWGDEVGYEEMTGLMKMEEHKRNKVRQRDGYQKIIWSCKQAMKDGYKWLWIDTCCIDKRSSSELSEAINSMYRWYQNAHVCYAYLSDVGHSVFSIERDSGKFGELYGWSEWFMRGWTLQELIAPKQVEFFNKHWTPIGSKHRLAPTLEEITGIPCEVLTGGLAAKRLCVAQIMSWAADRKTTRVEDRAYSLMGLFKVNMPMLYGEGEKAFQRLQLEIIRVSSDHSIFAWDPLGMIRRSGSVLADDPSDFRYCGNIKKVEPGEFVDRLMEETEENELGSPWYIRRGSSEISTNPVHWCRLAWLRWRARSLSQQFRTFSVNNAGIQVCLPVIPLPDSPCHFRAILACGYGFGLFTIDLVLSGSSFDRTFRIAETPKTYPAFKTLYLTHHQEANIVMHREFVLDDKHSSYHGFTRCGTYPREFTGDTVTLSSHTDDLIVIVYANDDARSRFAVGLGYCFGKGWVHLVYDECAVPHEVSWTQWSDFASSVYQRLWKARAEHARSMPKQEHDADLRSDHFIKHAHLPRSIWAARVIWGRWEADNYKLMIDIDQCPGCCDGPRGWTTTSSYCGGLGTPGLVDMNCYSYWLRLDGRRVQFDECSGQRIALGDYGDYSDGDFKSAGNIFEDMGTLGIDLTDSHYRPVVCRVSSLEWPIPRMENPVDVAVAHHTEGNPLALRQPKGLTLPENEHFELLLKDLAIHLAGKHLVISIVQCSGVYGVDGHKEQMDPRDNSALDTNNHSTEPGVLTPLCTIATPQVWQRELPCVQRRKQFKSIREHFYVLMNMHQPIGIKPHHKSANKQKKDGASRFFSDMFGLKHLRNYIGEIMFFRSLPMVTKSKVSADTMEEDRLPARPPKLSCTNWVMTRTLFKGSSQSNATQDQCLESVLPLLRRRCQILCAKDDAPHRYANEKPKLEHELKSIRQTLSALLLEDIRITFYDAYCEHQPFTGATSKASNIDYNRQLDIPSTVEEIEVLQMKLDMTFDDDEQRALEEDITGKILWLCWCGICAEVDQLLPKIVDHIRREGYMMGLSEISNIICCAEIEPDDDQVHLQRIMLDAGAGTSKHQLWLAARAAEEAKWSSTTRDTPTINNKGSTPDTSTQTLSQPIA